MRSRSDRTSDEVSWHNQPGKKKGLLESLTKCQKRNLAIYPVILTSRLVSNANLKLNNDENKNSRHALKHSAFVLTACFPSFPLVSSKFAACQEFQTVRKIMP